MVAMGLINLPSAWAGPPELKKGAGDGKSVVILGAGIGGLTTAYLLSQYGYRCQILEASPRAGGRKPHVVPDDVGAPNTLKIMQGHG
jgi:monoamine oxidase